MEVGWTGNNGGQDAPRSYFEFVTGSGSDSGPRFGPNVQAGNYPNYKITAPDPPNPAGNYRWTAYRNSVSFDSVVLGFNRGELHTNSERRNTCDTWYADFKSLDNCRTVSSGSCNWNGSYLNLQCHRTDGDGTYKFDKVSNSHHYVRTGSGVTC